MSKEDEAERARLTGKIIPARPKGAAPEPGLGTVRPSGSAALDEMLSKRKALRETVPPPKFSFNPEDLPAEIPEQSDAVNLTAFHSFTLIMRTLRKYPKTTQKEMIGLISEMLMQE